MPGSDAAQRLIGRVLDERYRIEKHLGGGGMGEVFEATQLELGRPVALKVLAPELAKEPVFLERFRREAQAAACLGNPHIVQVSDLVLPESGPPFLVMERLIGESVMDVLVREGPFELSRAVRIMIQLLDALATAHDAGIIHRDIKPPNVFLVRLGGGDEMVKLVDFGIAKLQQSAGAQKLTAVGALVGTPRFAAPEQLRGGEIDARTDVYGAGTLLYGMIAGRPPFGGPADDLIRAILSDMPLDLRITRPEVPPALAEAALKAMAKDPNDRFQTVREFAAALGDRSPRPKAERPSSLPVASAPASALPPTAAGNERPRQWFLIPFLLAGLMVVGLSVALIGVALREPERIELVKIAAGPVVQEAGLLDCQEYEAFACQCDGPDGAAICEEARASVARMMETAGSEPEEIAAIGRWCQDARRTEDCELDRSERAAAFSPPVAIEPGVLVGALDDTDDVRGQTGAFMDRYTIELRANERIEITMRSAAFDAFLLLRNRERGLLAANDDATDLEYATDAQLAYSVREAGSYIIEAAAAAEGEVGEYDLTVAVTPAVETREVRRERRRRQREREEQGGTWGVL